MDILPKHVSDNIRVIFNKYYSMYCKYEDIIRTTKEVISDINYFNEHMNRTKKSSIFTYNATVTKHSSIHNNFVEIISKNINQNLNSVDASMVFISIYQIMSSIFDNWFDESSNCAEQYAEFKSVLEYYLTNNPDEFIPSFIGCSHGIMNFKTKLNQIQNN